jgi:hypothetical protein
MDIVQVVMRETYGVERIYPVCEIANIFTRLTRQKTFSHENIALIKQLGYAVVVVPQTVKEI